MPAFPNPRPSSLLGRLYVARLRREGVRKLSASNLKEVERLDAQWARVREERIARGDSLLCRVRGAA